jgi:hypothetical protein
LYPRIPRQQPGTYNLSCWLVENLIIVSGCAVMNEAAGAADASRTIFRRLCATIERLP